MVKIENLYYLGGLACVLFLTIMMYRDWKKPNRADFEREKQTDLLSKIDVTLIGIDCRLRNIEEKNSGG